MFCPNCGAVEQSADAYCKRCGKWLPEMSGFVRRALWGEGIKPEQKLRTVLNRQVFSAVLAFAAAILLLIGGTSLAGSRNLVYAVAIICLFVGVMQVDGFFIALRLRQSFERNRAHAAGEDEPPAQSQPAAVQAGTEAAELDDAHVMMEETTRQLEPLSRGQRNVE